jgi:hypothetical protein
MDLIDFKNSLSRVSVQSKLISDVVALIREKFPDPLLLNSLRMDLQLIEYICNVVKNALIGNKEDDLDNVCIQIISIIHNLSPDDIVIIRKQIIYLRDNKKIKDVSLKKYIYKKTTNWFIKKFS